MPRGPIPETLIQRATYAGYKEVTKVELYALIAPTPGLATIQNKFEHYGCGYMTHHYSDHYQRNVCGISECGDFPFTESRYFWKS